MESQFGAKIRALREKQNLFLRQIASLLEMDTAQLSKIEKGSRQLKREQIPVIAEILKTDKEELLTLWLADQVMEVLNGEPLADEALKSVTKKRKQDNVN
jgi:transcriptional regulator with XRE-family HTH domain